MSVTVQEILKAAHAGVASVTGETAGYLVLGVADRTCARAGRLELGAAHLAEDGSLSVAELGDGTAVDLEADLRELLMRLVAVSRPSAPPLARIARPAASRGVLRLVAEIEAALIPVNRSAARRALSRVHRDVARAKVAGKLDAAPEPARAAPPPLPPPVDPEQEAAPALVLVPFPAPERTLERPLPRVVLSPPAPFATASFMVPEPTPIVPVAVMMEAEPMPAEVVAVSPQVLSASVYEPEATPFLGAWPGFAPVVTELCELPPLRAEDHDTELLPPVADDSSDIDDGWGDPDVARSPAPAEAASAPCFDAAPTRISEIGEARELADAIVDLAESDEPMDAPSSARVEPTEPEEPVPAPAVVAVAEPTEPEEPPAALLPVAAAEPTEPEEPVPAPAVVAAAEPTEPEELPAALLPVAAAEPTEPEEPARVTASASVETVEMLALIDGDAMTGADAPELLEALSEAPALGLPPAPSEDLVQAFAASPEPPSVEPEDAPAPAPEAAIPITPYRPRRSDVAELLLGFAVADSRTLREISRDLKSMAGVAGTPCPPAVAARVQGQGHGQRPKTVAR